MITYRTATPLQKTLTVLVLAFFLATVFLGFAAMMHIQEGGMQGNCPFSAMGSPLCPQNITAAVIHHISAYRSFLAVFAGSGAALILVLLIALYAAYLFSNEPFIYKPPAYIRSVFITRSVTSHDLALIRWLSRFENSPSIV